MATTSLTQRAHGDPETPSTGIDRILGHPAAFVATALMLLVLFGGTFFANPERVAPTKDPAYYTWRTEALMTEKPEDFLAVEGAFGMFEGGYRVAAPVLGGMLRQVADVAPLRSTAVLMVVTPVLTALLLAGFAYRHRRDPLLWHAVALGSASLMFTPPFVGYLDNVLCLLFLAAALHFIPGTTGSWPARIGFGIFLLLAGLTHPTTLVIFCLVLGMMAGARLLLTRFNVKETWRADGPMLITAGIAAVLTFLIWTVGIWGRSSALSEAALAPPYGSDFFLARLNLWIDAMRPALNGPLLLLGIGGLVIAGKRAFMDDMTRVSLLWLAPLVGIFGFLAGKAYPYYRFLNTTLSWVFLLGVGMYFALRFFLGAARGGGLGLVGYVGVLAILLVIATNFTKGFEVSGWNNVNGGWLSVSQKTDLDALRARLSEPDADGRPVVFVIDNEVSDKDEFQIWGFTKLSGNTSRYGLPSGMIDQGYLYLGALDKYLANEPTLKGFETYDKLSPALLEDTRLGIERAGKEPIVVVAKAFNSAGENSQIFESGAAFEGESVWFLQEGTVSVGAPGAEDGVAVSASAPDGSNILLVILGLCLLVIPGLLAFRWFVPDGGIAVALGLVPTLSAAILSLVGTILLAVLRSPFGASLAITTLVLAVALGGVLFSRSGTHPISETPSPT
ncbi:MAG: hypothetical protein H0U53_01165 [Actinobacteria bacterium]|nr:hypothetical protein [Actinomycetota bacterium]